MCLKSDKVWSKKYVFFGFFRQIDVRSNAFYPKYFQMNETMTYKCKKTIQYCFVNVFNFKCKLENDQE